MDHETPRPELNGAENPQPQPEPSGDVSGTDQTGEGELPLGQWIARNAPYLLVALALLVFLYFRFGPGGMLSIAMVGIGLGLMIFVHELGHFLVAKWCGVKVDVFSIGFGPAIPGMRFKWGETWYKLAVFPLGGYVQMLGQVDLHEEDDETDDDPRSYRNKSVWQRMAIISAGVVMNIILGVVCFLTVFLGPGMERWAPVIPAVDSGSPAFIKGVRTGAVIERVGGTEQPYFQDLMREVLAYHVSDTPMPLAFRFKEGPRYEVELKPELNPAAGLPAVGIGFPPRLQLAQKRAVAPKWTSPTLPGSPAAKAGFAFEDKIVASTDPDAPDQLKELPLDWRVPEGDPNYGQRDYFAFVRRMMRLAGKEVVVRVERNSGEAAEVRVPPAYHRTLGGAVMAMGEITAIREGSAAEKAGLQIANKAENIVGDVIEEVRVVDPDGMTIVYAIKESSEPGEKVRWQRLDPTRLPDQLRKWADAMRSAGAPESQWRVTVVVNRHNSPEKKPGEPQFRKEKLELQWDDSWRFDQVRPISRDAPIAVPELGLAYQVRTNVVFPPADKAGDSQLRAGDVIEEIRFLQIVDHEGNQEEGEWYDLKDEDKLDDWAFLHEVIQSPNVVRVDLKVKRDGETISVQIEPREDRTWPRWQRGLILERDTRLQKAGNIFTATTMGISETWHEVSKILLVLRGIVTGKISMRGIGGPVLIAQVAYQAASFDFWKFVVLIGIISINLAIVNFLPIPVLDGGHMVFLLYELIRGKPASEGVRKAATMIGLLLIAALFIFVMYNDITRLIFGSP